MTDSSVTDSGVTDSFPRQYARTQRLTLGEPRNIVVSPDGKRIVFVRSRGGSDSVNCLWTLDATTGEERLVADPVELLEDPAGADLPAEERARRERAREGAAGVVAYATDKDVTVAAFALAGRLYGAGLMSAKARRVPVDGPVFDPRPDPTARRIAYVSGGGLWVAELNGATHRVTPDEHDPEITWGAADFIAAEEINRSRGYWWSPDGQSLAVCRVDTSPVQRWYLGDPAHPEQAPRELPYPAAGTSNAVVSLHLISLDGASTEVLWDGDAFPYLVDVSWVTEASLLVTVQSRDQKSLRVLSADAESGLTVTAFADDDEAWVDLVSGVPSTLADGRLVMCADRDGARRLLVDGQPVTPTDIQVRSVVACDGDTVYFHANSIDDATVQHACRWSQEDGVVALTDSPGIHSVVARGGTAVIRSASLDNARTSTAVLGGPLIESHAETALVTPSPTLLRAGARQIATAVLLPTGRSPGDGGPKLPVLMDPYAGPHAQRVVQAASAYFSSQWFADQGFAVVVADGAGTPGRGSVFEREVKGDLAEPVLEDQISALHAAADEIDLLDLERVGIRGWSFGGWVAALAVLRRPDIFHAAVAGAPVTDWRLYDTHYTERYLGDPNVDTDVYDANSLLLAANELTRPLMIIHGLADDNVVSAHTLQFSSALLAAGRPHEVLPLSGVSHMTPQEVVAENLLLLQLDFLRRNLG